MMLHSAPPLSRPRPQPSRSPKAPNLGNPRRPAQSGLVLSGFVLALFALTAPVSSQTPPPRNLAIAEQTAPLAKPTIEFDERSNTVSFSMPDNGGMPLIDFIKWVQEVSGKRFTFNSQELGSGSSAGSAVNFLGTFRINKDRFQEDFYAFFQTMLYIKGFAVIPRGEGDLELLEIVMMAGSRGREVSNSARYVTPEDLSNYRYQTGVPILTTVPLRHINAQLANNALRPFFASTGGSNAAGSVQIGNVGNKSSLLLQGFGPQVFAAAQLLKLVDAPDSPSQKNQNQPQRPGKPAEVLVTLEHTDVAYIQQLLEIGGIPEQDALKQAAAPHARALADDEETESIAFSMTERDGMELTEFIEWAQQITGKRFTFNPQELASGLSGGSKVNFLGTFQFKRERFQQDFYAFFQTMLYIKGFAIVPRGEGDLELLEIVMMRGTRGREVTNGARYVRPNKIKEYRYQSGVPILTTVRLHNINAQLANNALRPFFASTGGMNAGGSVTIGNVGNKSSLLLQGFGPQVYAAVELLKLVDSRNRIHVVARAAQHGSKQALRISGEQEQVRKALDLIARADVPNAGKTKADHRRGFGFTSFGQATFQDTDDDGLPDTRLPDFNNPVQGVPGGRKKAPRRSGKSVIF